MAMRKFSLGLLSIGVLFLTGLSSSFVNAQTLFEDGFYRKDGEDVVFRLFTRNGERLSCGIASGEHLRNLGGDGQLLS